MNTTTILLKNNCGEDVAEISVKGYVSNSEINKLISSTKENSKNIADESDLIDEIIDAICEKYEYIDIDNYTISVKI